MTKHPDYKANMDRCPCCDGRGMVANCPCCSHCCGSGVQLGPVEIRQLEGSSLQKKLWYVSRRPQGFPNGPGSRYLHQDGTWHCSTTAEQETGKFPGLFPTAGEARQALTKCY